jgi:hypothetical protein
LLLDAARLRKITARDIVPLAPYHAEVLRRMLSGLGEMTGSETTPLIIFVLEVICGFGAGSGNWTRGAQIGVDWGRRAVTGESIRPRHLWRGPHGSVLPVFTEDEPRLGIGKSRRTLSNVLQWLRGGTERIAVVTNGRQWRLMFAGLDFDAWCEWDTDLWLEEGGIGAQVDALRSLVTPLQVDGVTDGDTPPLVQAILESRKGQAELSAALGERVREAVELVVQSHSEVLESRCQDVAPADIYRAAVRVVMRMVVVLFAESRDLLPRDSALYHAAYGLGGLISELERTGARGGNRLKRQYSGWPRLLALFRLMHDGSHHPALPVPAYGGELFAPASRDGAHGMERAVAAFEQGCFEAEILADATLLQILERLTRTKLKVRQGRATTWVVAPVDFSDLSSEYIGILYEGLLDFELRTAPANDPVIFLAVGNQPALPLSRLEAMEDAALKQLLEKMKDTSKAGDDDEEVVEETDADEATDETESEDDADDDPTPAEPEDENPADARLTTRTRAEEWARRAVAAGKLVRALKGNATPQKRAEHDQLVARKARQLVTRVVLPGERYLVRWGGTRKGSGSFYTRPGLAVPLVQRTLRPLAWNPPPDAGGSANPDAPPADWVPKRPEEILTLKVCDPACGSGTFPVGALRFLTDSLYASLNHHRRIVEDGDQSLVTLLGDTPIVDADGVVQEQLGAERLPSRPDDPAFEPRLKALLRRHVVERCIYGVDLDPLAVELCRLALWIETMDRSLPFSFLDHKIKCGNGLIGAWFDQFQHYPVMAWKNREGGDKSHSNGVHFGKEARGKAIGAWVNDSLKPDLQRLLAGQTLFDEDRVEEVAAVHAASLETLRELHGMPVQDSAARAKRYRKEFLSAPAWRNLKTAMDRYCACWFWPADQLALAPLPTAFGAPGEESDGVVVRIAAEKRFFHWELEFPDVFQAVGSGFNAILGNPPWDVAKPSSKEFFSAIDPLYRAYGKQEALAFQRQYFEDAAVERRWLDFSADFRAQSNFVGYSSIPFGDPDTAAASEDRYRISGKKKENAAMHERWREARSRSAGYADARHPYRHQGSADVNLYKLFLEQAHALMCAGGRLGFIVPSGLYSDHGTGALRKLFLDHCQWEWLFGFENREKIFDIHRSYKFNPVIIVKGGRTESIRTAFMRRTFAEWERAEQIATPYSREQVGRFSPKSRSILEVESTRDLEILEKIYANSVLLGDEGPDGWGVKYATEFHMTNDSKLFPPRPKWEAQGYRPDEYSRWLKGNWRPIAELWPELGIDPSRVVPADVELEEWLFNPSATPEERIAGAEFVHGHLLKPGDVQRTPWRVRCAQPPYDALPITRADIPAGIILSREVDEWIRESDVHDMALPLYEGRMIGQFDFSQKGWVSGKGRGAKWVDVPFDRKTLNPQYCMAESDYEGAKDKEGTPKAARSAKVGFMDVASATNERTMIAAVIYDRPSGNSSPVLKVQSPWALAGLLASFAYDYVSRRRCSGLHLNWFVISESPLPRSFCRADAFGALARRLTAIAPSYAPEILVESADGGPTRPAITASERLRLEVQVNAIVMFLFGFEYSDALTVFEDCDHPSGVTVPSTWSPKGFWRIDRSKPTETRSTILAIIALADLWQCVADSNGDANSGIDIFLGQHNGDGWQIPEWVRLSEYTLGRDDRAKIPQPVASLLGPRFLDWQLAQSADDSWRECHLHARNVLGEAGYRGHLDRIRGGQGAVAVQPTPATATARVAEARIQPNLFE